MVESFNYCSFMTKLVYIALHRVLNIDTLQGLDTKDIMVLITSIHLIIEIH
jgi:hypothetical protein